MNKTPLFMGAAAFGSYLASAPVAHAAYVVDFRQVGGNVVATGAGTLDLTDLTFDGYFAVGPEAELQPNAAYIEIGNPPTDAAVYDSVAGPSLFGPGGFSFTTSTGGALVEIMAGTADTLAVPIGYKSGAPLPDAKATWDNSTFASLGLTPGTYVYTWGSGADADSFTINIAAPEPATWAMMLAGLAGLGAALRTRRASAV